MKTLIALLFSLSAASALANQPCNYLEAQILSTVKSVTVEANGQCRVTFSWEKRWLYNPSYSCPLDIDEVSSFGAVTSNCNYQVGEDVSGVVYRPKNGNPLDIVLY